MSALTIPRELCGARKNWGGSLLTCAEERGHRNPSGLVEHIGHIAPGRWVSWFEPCPKRGRQALEARG